MAAGFQKECSPLHLGTNWANTLAGTKTLPSDWPQAEELNKAFIVSNTAPTIFPATLEAKLYTTKLT